MCNIIRRDIKSMNNESQEEREKYRRIDNLADNNPWLQDKTMSDIDKAQ